jgi:hypothetical protein
MSLQTPAGSGSPVGTFVQRPFVAASAHDWHDPLHAEPQHTPCAQNPERHSTAAEQLAPSGLGPQVFPASSHTRGARQFESFVHEPKQTLPLHTYGLQGTAGGTSHVPLALHVDGGV